MVNFKSYRIWILFFYVIIMFANSMFTFIDIPIKHIWKYDKIIHYIQYFILGILLFHAIYELPESKKNVIYWIIGVSIIPVFDESIQYFTPNRIPSLYDAFADYAGCYSGCYSYHILSRFSNG